VAPSPWPLITSLSLFILTLSAVMYFHGFYNGGYLLSLGFILTMFSMTLWFRDVTIEGTYLGNHTLEVQKGLTIGVALFIVSEVFAFISVFWAFFHSSLAPAIEIGGIWPPFGIQALDPFAIPLLNTVKSAINVAVWVQISLFILNLSNNLVFFFLPKIIFYIQHVSLHWKPQLIKSYSTINIEDDKEFYKWFSGFTDAEGLFIILALPEGFNFKFSIGLHIDDLPVLNYIKDKLGFGIVYSYKYNCSYNVTKKEDILKIITIFDNYKLNSSKRLDYLDLKKAFYLYKNRTKLSKELINQILVFKKNMNTQRTIFEVSEVNISKSWLLGFIEGDGSFSLSRTSLEPVFSITLTESQLPLLLEIKKYLENNLGFDPYSKLKSSSIIYINKTKEVNNSKPLATLKIKNIHVLNNYFIPFFNECKFISKKGLDFNDYKIICKAIYIGAHRIKYIKDLIIKLSYTMNNYRLSTYLGKVESINLSERSEIIKAKATIEYLKDGIPIDIDTKKIVNNRSSSCIYEIIKSSGEILIKFNLSDSAKELGIGFNTLKKQFYDQGFKVEYKGNKIKRIGIFQAKI
jgi:hypothetical protein